MKPRELVEAALKGINAPSRYALHKATGMSEQALSDYVNGKRWPDNNAARLLAEAAGLDPLEVIAKLEIEKATDEATRTSWGKALATMRARGLAFVVAMVCAVSALTAPVQTPGRVFSRRRLSIIFIM